VLLDTSGDALAAALSGAGALPYAVKPNRHELEAWAGTPLLDRSALRAAGRALVERGVALVAISMGADGALFIDRSGALVTTGATGAGQHGRCRRRHGRRHRRRLLEPSLDLAGCARLATAFSMSRLRAATRDGWTRRRCAWTGDVLIERLD
jgi:1-phosphofructokinase